VRDDRLAPYRDLTDAELRRRIEGAGRIFVVEGHLAIRNLLASPYEVRSMLVAESRVGPLDDLIGAVPAAGGDVLVAPLDVLAATVGFNLHRGVVALGVRPQPTEVGAVLAAVRRAGNPLIALIEGVNDHENLGALFRNAAAFGAGAVILDPTSADPLYRRSIRVSLGHVLRLPWARSGPWPEALLEVQRAGFGVVALTPAVSAPELSTLATGRPVGVLVGAEGHGLSTATLAGVSERARIPMAPGVDSLNVATAAAIAFHHFAARLPPEAAD
jgi:tRNA G18 (ribose-2'-O)-methylase SpoU